MTEECLVTWAIGMYCYTAGIHKSEFGGLGDMCTSTLAVPTKLSLVA